MFLRRQANRVNKIRFAGGLRTLSYLLDAEWHGKGLGRVILSLGLKAFSKECNNVKIINAYVLHENLSSAKVFERMGFDKIVSLDHILYTKKMN